MYTEVQYSSFHSALTCGLQRLSSIHNLGAAVLILIWTATFCIAAARWKGRAVAVKVMLASAGDHASELESFRRRCRC